MDQNTVNLILYVEQLVALAAKSVVDLKNVLVNNQDPTVALNDADATYQKIIANATPAPEVPPTPSV